MALSYYNSCLESLGEDFEAVNPKTFTPAGRRKAYEKAMGEIDAAISWLRDVERGKEPEKE